MQQLLLEHSVPSYTLIMYVGIVDIAQIVIKTGVLCQTHLCIMVQTIQFRFHYKQ